VLRPRAESGDKWRDGDVGRRVANVEIIGAEPQIEWHDEGGVSGDDDGGAAEIAPPRPEAEHCDMGRLPPPGLPPAAHAGASEGS